MTQFFFSLFLPQPHPLKGSLPYHMLNGGLTFFSSSSNSAFLRKPSLAIPGCCVSVSSLNTFPTHTCYLTDLHGTYSVVKLQQFEPSVTKVKIRSEEGSSSSENAITKLMYFYPVGEIPRLIFFFFFFFLSLIFF